MKVFIAGIDGYLGWAYQEHLRANDIEVDGCDNHRRRNNAKSLVPIERDREYSIYDASFSAMLHEHLRRFKPDVILHLAQEPSAPYSMLSTAAAIDTLQNNCGSTMSILGYLRRNPETHLVKLGTIGEYGPSSIYHISKVNDTALINWMTKTFGLRVTDVMQGPVYGIGGRLDYDECWGTVINRFVIQGIHGGPLTVYGNGGQLRFFLPVSDVMQCLDIIVQNPAKRAQHRIVDQYSDMLEVGMLARKVADLTDVGIEYLHNPRAEGITYDSEPDNKWLREKGFKPLGCIDENIENLIEAVLPYKNSINPELFWPKIQWS